MMDAQQFLVYARVVMASVEFWDGYEFHVVMSPREEIYLQARYLEADATKPATKPGSEPEWQYTRKWMLSPAMTESELVFTAFKLCMTSTEHRTREAFKYLGERIASPHFDVQDLVRLSREGRADAGARK